MSSWGNLDNVAITGNVTVTAGSAIVQNALGNATVFLSEIDDGDYIIISGQKYQVRNVTSNFLLTLTDPSAATGNVRVRVQQGPKYIANIALNANTYTIQRVFGVDRFEANVAENNNRNIKTPGWNHYFTYTDALGQTRHKNESIVAMSKNFNANAALALQTDASDDATVADFQLYFITQPSNQSNTAGNAVTFVSNANSIPVGATMAFQWYESSDNATFAKVNDGGNYTGNTTATLVIANVSAVNGNFYFVTASSVDGGADSANSRTVTANVA